LGDLLDCFYFYLACFLVFEPVTVFELFLIPLRFKALSVAVVATFAMADLHPPTLALVWMTGVRDVFRSPVANLVLVDEPAAAALLD